MIASSIYLLHPVLFQNTYLAFMSKLLQVYYVGIFMFSQWQLADLRMHSPFTIINILLKKKFKINKSQIKQYIFTNKKFYQSIEGIKIANNFYIFVFYYNNKSSLMNKSIINTRNELQRITCKINQLKSKYSCQNTEEPLIDVFNRTTSSKKHHQPINHSFEDNYRKEFKIFRNQLYEHIDHHLSRVKVRETEIQQKLDQFIRLIELKETQNERQTMVRKVNRIQNEISTIIQITQNMAYEIKEISNENQKKFKKISDCIYHAEKQSQQKFKNSLEQLTSNFDIRLKKEELISQNDRKKQLKEHQQKIQQIITQQTQKHQEITKFQSEIQQLRRLIINLDTQYKQNYYQIKETVDLNLQNKAFTFQQLKLIEVTQRKHQQSLSDHQSFIQQVKKNMLDTQLSINQIQKTIEQINCINKKHSTKATFYETELSDLHFQTNQIKNNLVKYEQQQKKMIKKQLNINIQEIKILISNEFSQLNQKTSQLLVQQDSINKKHSQYQQKQLVQDQKSQTFRKQYQKSEENIKQLLFKQQDKFSKQLEIIKNNCQNCHLDYRNYFNQSLKEKNIQLQNLKLSNIQVLKNFQVIQNQFKQIKKDKFDQQAHQDQRLRKISDETQNQSQSQNKIISSLEEKLQKIQLYIQSLEQNIEKKVEHSQFNKVKQYVKDCSQMCKKMDESINKQKVKNQQIAQQINIYHSTYLQKQLSKVQHLQNIEKNIQIHQDKLMKIELIQKEYNVFKHQIQEDLKILQSYVQQIQRTMKPHENKEKCLKEENESDYTQEILKQFKIQIQQFVNTFSQNLENRVLKIQHSNKEQRQKWIKVKQQMENNLKKNISNQVYLNMSNQFSKISQIIEKTFEELEQKNTKTQSHIHYLNKRIQQLLNCYQNDKIQLQQFTKKLTESKVQSKISRSNILSSLSANVFVYNSRVSSEHLSDQ